jgi:hypothetical protein
MEQEKVFVLTDERTYKRSLNIYVYDPAGKLEKRNIVFTTEHLIDKSQRSTNAKRVAAQYFAQSDAEVRALLSSSGYGKTFVRIDDPAGKLKLPTVFVSPDDAEKAALKILFDKAKLEFDPRHDASVLKKEYEIYIMTLAGTNKIGESTAKEIPGEPVNVQAGIENGVNKAKALFQEKYGYPIPEIVENDLGFLSWISDCDAPADKVEKYISDKEKSLDKSVPTEGSIEEPTLEELQKQYFIKKNANVPNIKKNDAAWIKMKLAE